MPLRQHRPCGAVLLSQTAGLVVLLYRIVCPYHGLQHHPQRMGSRSRHSGTAALVTCRLQHRPFVEVLMLTLLVLVLGVVVAVVVEVVVQVVAVVVSRMLR